MEFMGAAMCFIFATVMMFFVLKLAQMDEKKDKKKKNSGDPELEYWKGYAQAQKDYAERSSADQEQNNN